MENAPSNARMYLQILGVKGVNGWNEVDKKRVKWKLFLTSKLFNCDLFFIKKKFRASMENLCCSWISSMLVTQSLT